MKVGHDVDLFDRHIMTAEPGDYDATPSLPLLSVNSWPHRLPSSRRALAMGLCYLSSTSGLLEVQANFTPATAERLQDVYPHRRVTPAPIDYAPADVPHCQLRTRVTTQVGVETDTQCDNTLHLLPADRFTGQMASTRDLWVSSNAVWSGVEKRSRDDFHRLLTVMVLFSEDVNTRVFDLGDDIAPADLDLAPYNRILRTVGLSLERCDLR